jgi:hypothetical protein
MAVIENGIYAVQSADVSVVYKTDTPASPPDRPATYELVVIPRGTSSPYSPRFRWLDENSRDEFYKKLVDAMGQ